jgi:predicted component of type VI protein secretion system
MAKLVILNQGMTGRTFDLNIERTTVGRIEENTFQIADASVSSRHAEIILKGEEIHVKDIGSTNGTFINNEKIEEKILLPGQTLRFGQVELKIDDGKPVTAPPAPSPSSAPVPATPSKKPATDGTMIMPRGVSLEQLEQGGAARPSGFDTNTAFSKKKTKINKFVLIGGIVIAVIILGLIIVLISKVSGGHQ